MFQWPWGQGSNVVFKWLSEYAEGKSHLIFLGLPLLLLLILLSAFLVLPPSLSLVIVMMN
jgi:hypothetical protein